MGFFKEFKDDLSQAVNELLPEDDLNQEEKDTEDKIVNTLDSDEFSSEDAADNDKMKEWLEEFAQDNSEVKADGISNEEADDQVNNEIIQSDAENSASAENTVEKDEEENMDDNVDLELVEALNSNEETEQKDESEQKEEDKETSKLKAASIVNDEDVTVITKGTTINGSISSDGSLDVKGTITGDIECLGKLTITGKVMGNSSASEVFVSTDRLEGGIASEGSVKVGLGTVVIGDVTATSGVIAGAIKGEIDINGPVVIDSTAIIKGNIKAKSIQVNNGAVVEGFCSLSYANVDVDNIFE